MSNFSPTSNFIKNIYGFLDTRPILNKPSFWSLIQAELKKILLISGPCWSYCSPYPTTSNWMTTNLLHKELASVTVFRVGIGGAFLFVWMIAFPWSNKNWIYMLQSYNYVWNNLRLKVGAFPRNTDLRFSCHRFQKDNQKKPFPQISTNDASAKKVKSSCFTSWIWDIATAFSTPETLHLSCVLKLETLPECPWISALWPELRWEMVAKHPIYNSAYLTGKSVHHKDFYISHWKDINFAVIPERLLV